MQDRNSVSKFPNWEFLSGTKPSRNKLTVIPIRTTPMNGRWKKKILNNMPNCSDEENTIRHCNSPPMRVKSFGGNSDLQRILRMHAKYNFNCDWD